MAKQETFKCAGCGHTFSKDVLRIINGKKYCPDCYAQNEGYLDVMTYITEHPKMCKGDTRYCPWIGRQLHKLHDENGWGYKEILYTLRFVYDYKDNGLKRIPDFDFEYGFQWIVEAYFAVAQDAIRAERERKRKFEEEFPTERIKQIVNIPPKIIEIHPDDYKRDLAERQERIKTYLYGPEMDLNDIEEE